MSERLVHIIGGGITGLCSAWYLREAGFDVTVIDRTDMQDGCSFGNAGLIVPSHCVPLAAPGVVAKGLRWMFSARSPFYIRPRMDAGLLRWLWRFYRSCNQRKTERAAPVLRDFHLLSRALYGDLAGVRGFAFDYAMRGSLTLFRTLKGEEEEIPAARYAQSLGLDVEILGPDEVQALEPAMGSTVRGAVLHREDAQLNPGRFILQMQRLLQERGVKLLGNHAVKEFRTSAGRITHVVPDGEPAIAVDNVVLAAGAWTGLLARKLGLRLPMQDGKGYSVTLQHPPIRPALPAILSEARVALTPMGDDLRVAGTLEISGFSSDIDRRRVAAMLDAILDYYPAMPPVRSNDTHVWHGYRPVTPDGLPYIGRSSRHSNLIVAAGHAMLGMSLGPATGLLVSEIMIDSKPSLPVELFEVGRFG